VSSVEFGIFLIGFVCGIAFLGACLLLTRVGLNKFKEGQPRD
jgi:hypothetical protein